jgi:predicted Fe-Mo cluster-binding NifX family protein
MERGDHVLVAVPEFNGRVSPTFDFCHRVTLWRVDERGCRRVGVRVCRHSTTEERATQLRSFGVEMLLCGAIGDDAVRVLQACGIQVRMGSSGAVAHVVAAFVCGGLDDPRFCLPGFERTQSAVITKGEG